MGLLLAAFGGAWLFVLAESRAASPLIEPQTFRNAGLRSSLAASALVATVMMATLVIGPFYLSRALGLGAAMVGIVMSAGPLAAALTGVPSGRLVDRFGPPRMTMAGLAAMAAGCVALSTAQTAWGVAGYLAPILVATAGYALFQAANNTAALTEGGANQRGVTSGMLNLSRNLGLVTGTSVMGAVFASTTPDVTTAQAETVAAGMRMAFTVATIFLAAAMAVSWAGKSEKRSVNRAG